MTEYNERRHYKFHDCWLEMEEFQDWLEKTNKKSTNNHQLAFCKLCDCTIVSHKSDLMKHRNSEKHKKNETKMGLSRDIEIPSEITESAKRAENVKKAETSLYAFTVKHNLSIQATDCLVSLCQNIFPDSDIASNVASKRRKTTQTIKRAVGNIYTKKLHEPTTMYAKLKVPGMFFSINMKETIDPSAIKQYTLTAAFMDGEHGVRYSFFDMFRVKSGPAVHLYSSLKNSILSRGIPLENLVGFSSGPNPIFSHLQKDCPDIAYIKFSCHTIHLAASKACLKLPTNVEDLLKNLGSHFSRNYGKEESFMGLQELFHVDIHKIAWTTTRWLSVKECVKQVLEQYDPLQTYIRPLCIHDPDDIYQNILDTMKNPYTKAYMQFMSYVLEILSEFNLMFHEERPLIHKMKPTVEKLIKDICLNFLPTDYVIQTPAFEIQYTDPIFYLPLDKIYPGVDASEIINAQPDTEEKEIESFFENILNFYVELVTVVREEFDLSDELYDIISNVDPQVAQDYNTLSLIRLWKRFPVLKPFINVQALDNEWKRHALLNHHLEGLDPKMPFDKYWQKVFKLKSASGEPAFPNLYTAMKLLLVLPFFPTQVLNSH